MNSKLAVLKEFRYGNSLSISYSEYGSEKGVPTFYSHGIPSCSFEADIFHSEAKKRGYRIISIDRAGIRHSDNLSDHSLLGYPILVERLAKHLNIDKFGLVGWSGGGAYTLACSYILSDRVLFSIVIAGYTNFAELDAAASYLKSPLDRFFITLALKSRILFQTGFYAMRLGFLFFPNYSFKAFRKTLDSADYKLTENRSTQLSIIQLQKMAFRKGANVVAMDSLNNYTDWGFNLSDIKSKVTILHGIEDTLVPIKYSEKTCALIESCRLIKLNNRGHLFPINEPHLIFDAIEDIL